MTTPNQYLEGDTEMDRQYMAEHSVAVYETLQERTNGAPPVTTIDAKPYSRGGFDNYKYNNTVYAGFYDRRNGEIYIAKDAPTANYYR